MRKLATNIVHVSPYSGAERLQTLKDSYFNNITSSTAAGQAADIKAFKRDLYDIYGAGHVADQTVREEVTKFKKHIGVHDTGADRAFKATGNTVDDFIYNTKRNYRVNFKNNPRNQVKAAIKGLEGLSIISDGIYLGGLGTAGYRAIKNYRAAQKAKALRSAVGRGALGLFGGLTLATLATKAHDRMK